MLIRVHKRRFPFGRWSSGVLVLSVGMVSRVTHEPITRAYFEDSGRSRTEYGANRQGDHLDRGRVMDWLSITRFSSRQSAGADGNANERTKGSFFGASTSLTGAGSVAKPRRKLRVESGE